MFLGINYCVKWRFLSKFEIFWSGRRKNVSDNSLRVPKGTSGRVINVRVFRKAKGFELSDGSISLVLGIP